MENVSRARKAQYPSKWHPLRGTLLHDMFNGWHNLVMSFVYFWGVDKLLLQYPISDVSFSSVRPYLVGRGRWRGCYLVFWVHHWYRMVYGNSQTQTIWTLKYSFWEGSFEQNISCRPPNLLSSCEVWRLWKTGRWDTCHFNQLHPIGVLYTTFYVFYYSINMYPLVISW